MKHIIYLFIMSAALGAAFSLALTEKTTLYRIDAEVNDTLHTPVAHTDPVSSRVVFVGDIMMARDVERKMIQYGVDYPFVNMQSHLTGDAVVGNFEASIPKVHVPTPSMVMVFSVPVAHVPALTTAGFTHLSLANNHADDYGAEGYKNTVAVLNASSLQTFGRPYEVSTSSISYIHAGDRTIALIGLYAVDVAPSLEAVQEVVATASRASDLQIAYVHWGVEYELVHEARQENFAHALIDAGIDAVIGHHPHVVQDIERYRGSLIFYSLGNFVFDQYWNRDVSEGLLLDVQIEASGAMAYTLVPVSTIDSRTSPRPLAGFEKEEFLNALAQRSDPELRDEIQSGVIQIAVDAP